MDFVKQYMEENDIKICEEFHPKRPRDGKIGGRTYYFSTDGGSIVLKDEEGEERPDMLCLLLQGTYEFHKIESSKLKYVVMELEANMGKHIYYNNSKSGTEQLIYRLREILCDMKMMEIQPDEEDE